MTANKREKNLKNNNIVYIIEIVILTAAAVFLSVIGSTLFVDIIGFAGIMAVCIAVASALFACVLFLTKSRVIIPAAIISFAGTFILTQNMISSCASLIYIVIGLFIYFGVKKKNKRTQITVGISAVLTVLYAVILISSVVLPAGTFSPRETVASIDADLTNRLDGYIDQYSDVFMQYSGDETLASATDEERAVYFENYKKELVMNIKAILPSCFVLYSLIIAYLSTALFKHSYNIFIPMANPGRKRIKNKYWRINISAVSAIIMIISMILAMIFSTGDNLIGYIVLTNFVYILIPGFTIMGIYFAYDKMFKNGAGFFPVATIIGVVIAAFIFPFAIVAATAFFMLLGIYAALISDIKKYYDKLKKILLGDDDDDDDDYID